MRTSTRIPVLTAVLALTATAFVTPTAVAKGGEPSPMEIAGIDLVVKLDESDGYTTDNLERDFPVVVKDHLLASRGIYLLEPTDPIIRHDEGKAERLAEELKKNGDYVKYAEPDYATELADNRYHSWPNGTPQDAGDRGGPFYNQPLTERLRLPEVQQRSTGAGGTVAVLDTGVELDHPALAGSLIPGYDFVDDDADPSEVRQDLDANDNGIVDEAFGHGTFVAGMITLVAPDARSCRCGS